MHSVLFCLLINLDHQLEVFKGYLRGDLLCQCSQTWDVDIVLDYLAAMPDVEDMSLRLDALNGVVVDTSHWTERTGTALFES